MKNLLFLIFFISSLVTPVLAQLDPTFGNNGVVTISISPYDKILNSFELPDGKILILHQGNPASTNNQSQYYFIKLNANGTFDASYGNNGINLLSIPFINNDSASILDSLRQSDGKILLSGSDNQDGFVARLNENGTIDTTFGNNGFQRQSFFSNVDILTKIVLLPDGKIMGFGTSNTTITSRLFLIRFLSNGALDTNFGTANSGSIILDFPYAYNFNVVRQSSGKFIFQPSYGPNNIRRFNADGTLDTTFQSIPITSGGFNKCAVTNDDKIILAFDVLAPDNPSNILRRRDRDLSIQKYNSDGTSDTSFGINGKTNVDITSYQGDNFRDLEIDSNGKIVVASQTFVNPNRTRIKDEQFSIAKISPTGIVEGKTLFTSGNSSQIKLLQNGQILESGNRFISVDDYALIVAKLTTAPLIPIKLHATPLDFQFRGKTSVSVFRPSTTTWWKSPNDAFGSNFGLVTDVLTPSDFSLDSLPELAVFRPSNGFWYISADYFSSAQNFTAIQWGQNGDIPAPADFNGDSKSDIAVFRPSNGVWYILNTNDSSTRFFPWGMIGDKPVAGDYDGDGIYDIAIWRPSNGLWCIFYSSTNQPVFIPFGLSTDIPVQEDYDGDGKFDIAVWRPSNGYWYRLNSSDWSFTAIPFGLPTDNPIPADYDGDGKTDIGVKRNTDNKWYVLNSSNSSLSVYTFGLNTDRPLPLRE
jgi:uncharacterized delta-60 repeat protein